MSNLLDIPGVAYTRTGNATAWRSDGTLAEFAANQPRITDAGVTIEGQRTNLLARWDPTAAQVPVGGAGAVAVNCSDVAAPAISPLSGRNWIALDNSTGTAVAWAACQSIPASTVVSFSMLVETPDGSQPVWGTPDTSGVDFQVRSQNGADLTSAAAKYVRRSGNVWEVQVTGTTTSALSTSAFGPRRSASHTTRPLKFSGFQLELGTRASTPIITTGAAATVGADNLYLGGLGSVLAAPFSVVATATSADPTDPAPIVSLTALNSLDRVILYRQGSGIRAQVRANNTPVTSILMAATEPFRIAGAFSDGVLRWAVNGALAPPVAASGPFSAPLDELRPGSRWASSERANGVVTQTTLFPYALTDAELVELTR